MVSGRPVMRLKFCTATPAAPFTRLSSAASTTTFPFATRTVRSQKFVPTVAFVPGRPSSTRTKGLCS